MKDKIIELVKRVAENPWFPIGAVAITFIATLVATWIGMILCFVALGITSVLDTE